jgi:putative ABC transport system permease protein
MGIFLGLMTRTYGFITDTSQPDIWVMDPKVQYIDDIKPLSDTLLFRVRSIAGVAWAVPLYKGLLKARMDDGQFYTVNVIGLDDNTLIGGPPEMVVGHLADLRRSEAVIVDTIGAEQKLTQPSPHAGGQRVPLHLGDVFELNDHRARVVGLAKISRPFQSQPMVYTTYSRAMSFAPHERRMLSFVLVKAKPGEDLARLCERIRRLTGLAAFTREAFSQLTVQYYMEHTGIPVNFGVTVSLGFLVGTAIAGLLFYNFTLENLRHFGALKAMGTSNGVLLRMILLQALVVGSIGYGLGIGAAALFSYLLRNTELTTVIPWQLLVLSAVSVMLICLMSAVVSIRRVLSLEPAIVFRG